jgi:hypothetical protein
MSGGLRDLAADRAELPDRAGRVYRPKSVVDGSLAANLAMPSGPPLCIRLTWISGSHSPQMAEQGAGSVAPLTLSAYGTKRTLASPAPTTASDPKRTCLAPIGRHYKGAAPWEIMASTPPSAGLRYPQRRLGGRRVQPSADASVRKE